LSKIFRNDQGSAPPMHGKSLTYRQIAGSLSWVSDPVIDRQTWKAFSASQRLAAHQSGRAIAQATRRGSEFFQRWVPGALRGLKSHGRRFLFFLTGPLKSWRNFIQPVVKLGLGEVSALEHDTRALFCT
jgi:hypothetical protein